MVAKIPDFEVCLKCAAVILSWDRSLHSEWHEATDVSIEKIVEDALVAAQRAVKEIESSMSGVVRIR